MNVKETININTCRNFMEYTKLKLKQDIVFLRTNGYIYIYIYIYIYKYILIFVKYVKLQ